MRSHEINLLGEVHLSRKSVPVLIGKNYGREGKGLGYDVVSLNRDIQQKHAHTIG